MIEKYGKTPNEIILPTDKSIADYVETIWETTTSTAENLTKLYINYYSCCINLTNIL